MDSDLNFLLGIGASLIAGFVIGVVHMTAVRRRSDRKAAQNRMFAAQDRVFRNRRCRIM